MSVKAMKYIATMDTGEQAHFDTIAAARRWAESFGNTSQRCTIAPAAGKWSFLCVAVHERDTEGRGRRWYKATP